MIGFRVLALGIYIGAQHLDGRELVLADAPVEHLFYTGRGIEVPGAGCRNDRDGKWKRILADDQHRARAVFLIQLVALVVGCCEALPRRRIGDRIARARQLAPFFAEHSDDAVGASGLDRSDERVDGCLR